MLINQELYLEDSHTAVIEKLKKQLRPFPQKGTVSSNSFCLYKSLCSHYRKGYVCFVFSGKIESHISRTRLKYHVRPSWFTLLFAVILILPTPLSVICMQSKNVSTLFLLTSIVFNIIFHLSIYSQMTRCISQFNQAIKE